MFSLTVEEIISMPNFSDPKKVQPLPIKIIITKQAKVSHIVSLYSFITSKRSTVASLKPAGRQRNEFLVKQVLIRHSFLNSAIDLTVEKI